MRRVTIEGSIMPSVYLARGERRTVAVTDDIRNLVKIGAAVVVEGSLDPEPFDYGGVAVNDTGESIQAVSPSEPPEDPEPPIVEMPADGSAPAKNASRAAWAAFLTSKGVVFPDGDESAGELWAGRDDLIVIWQQASGGS